MKRVNGIMHNKHDSVQNKHDSRAGCCKVHPQVTGKSILDAFFVVVSEWNKY